MSGRSRLDKPVVLVGFMASGKSTIGPRLADALGVDFVDLDERIATQAKKSIDKIFRDDGEVGFRALERALMRQVLEAAHPVVIAAGGGAFCDPATRKVIQKHAHSVYLRARVETIISRLSPSQLATRPLLKGPDPEDAVARLLSKRQQDYERADRTIDVDEGTPKNLAEEIASRIKAAPEGADTAPRFVPSAALKPIAVRSRYGEYQVNFDPLAEGLPQQVGSHLRGERIAIVTDDTVAPLLGTKLKTALAQPGAAVTLHTIAPGEASKNLTTVGRLLDELLEAQLSRRDLIVALGGGIVGDVAGYVAASLLRGVDFVQVPTTTLAAIDSSVGGKTGVNTRHGKNLVGAFYAPRGVYVVGEHFQSLSEGMRVAGLIEALKIASCYDAAFFTWMIQNADALRQGEKSALLTCIRHAVALKAHVVSRDEMEAGERMVLNFGHTLGHAIEHASGYTIAHGEAVGLGMLLESEFFARKDPTVKSVAAGLRDGLLALGVDVARQFSVSVEALAKDKKRAGMRVTMPCVRAIGSFEFQDVPLEALREFVARRGKA